VLTIKSHRHFRGTSVDTNTANVATYIVVQFLSAAVMLSIAVAFYAHVLSQTEYFSDLVFKPVLLLLNDPSTLSRPGAMHSAAVHIKQENPAA
jgi:hypothetical protein